MSQPESKRIAKTPAQKQRQRRQKLNVFFKLVRRIHMYTGLFLLPWVLIFGFSGFLFNHPDILNQTREQMTYFSSDQVQEELGFSPVIPEMAADELIKQLNDRLQGKATLKRVENQAVYFTQAATFLGQGVDGYQYRVKVPLDKASASIQKSIPTADSDALADDPIPVPFAGVSMPQQWLSLNIMGSLLNEMLADHDIKLDGGLAVQRRGAPSLRFVLEDEQGQLWNTSYNLQNGAFTGRLADDPNAQPIFRRALTQLHRSHHYPHYKGYRWLWILFADVTALTMVFWGISGVIMWWQIKPTRFWGIISLIAALVIGMIITLGALGDINFTPRLRGGGGGGNGRNAMLQRGGLNRGGDMGDGLDDGM